MIGARSSKRCQVVPAQTLAWVTAQSGVTGALAAAKTPAQVEDNVRAVECDLNQADMARIEKILAGGSPAAAT